jgi:hypothetical protein
MPTPHPARLLWALRGLSTAVLFIGVLLFTELPLLGGTLITIGVFAVPAWWWWISRQERAGQTKSSPANRRNG